MRNKIFKREKMRTGIGKKGVATAFHFVIVSLLFIMMCITIMFFFWIVKYYNDKIDSYDAFFFTAKLQEKKDSLKIGGAELRSVENQPIYIYDFMLSDILYAKYNHFVNLENGEIKSIYKYRYPMISVLDSAYDKSSLFTSHIDRFKKLGMYLDYYGEKSTKDFRYGKNSYLLAYTSNVEKCNCIFRTFDETTSYLIKADNCKVSINYASVDNYDVLNLAQTTRKNEFCAALFKVGHFMTIDQS